MYMRRRIVAVLVAAAAATFAMGACGGGKKADGPEKTVVVGVDLPLQGPKKAAHEETVNALRTYLDQVGGKAGKFHVDLKVYDDSTAAKGAWDADTCKQNANDHVANADEVAMIGPVNSGCTQLMVPILNSASGSPMLAIT